MNDNSVKKILILAANPLDTVRLSLGQEVKEIRTTLQLSRNRDRFTIEVRDNVSPNQLQPYMYDLKPQIVHFSGHGVGVVTSRNEPPSTRKLEVVADIDSPPEGLVFEDENGRSILVSGRTLSNLCALFSKEVVCVVLNACYSQQQAEEIVKYIPYVVGMKREIGDIAARKFSEGFYRAIWDDRSIEEAFASGQNAIELDGIPEALTPVLLKNGSVPPKPSLPHNEEQLINGEKSVMQQEKPSQSLTISGSQVSGQVAQAGGNVTQTQHNQESPEQQRTITEVLESIDRIAALFKNSELSEELKNKAATHLEAAKEAVKEKEPDKDYAAKSLQKAVNILKITNDTVTASERLGNKVQPILKQLQPWLGVTAHFFSL
jgi:CHAT domain